MVRIFMAVAILIAGAAWGAAQAQQSPQPQTKKLESIRVSLVEPSVYKEIWSDAFDAELALRKTIGEKTKRPIVQTIELYAATFDLPEGKVIVSSADTLEAQCKTYKAIGLNPRLLTCPVRIAFSSQGKLTRIGESRNYTFILRTDDRGQVDNSGKDVRTLVTLNSGKKSLFTHLEDDFAASALEPGANDSVIPLKNLP